MAAKWRPRCLCCRPAVFFRRLCIIALAFPQRQVRRAVQKCFYFIFLFTSLKMLKFEISLIGKCLRCWLLSSISTIFYCELMTTNVKKLKIPTKISTNILRVATAGTPHRPQWRICSLQTSDLLWLTRYLKEPTNGAIPWLFSRFFQIPCLTVLISAFLVQCYSLNKKSRRQVFSDLPSKGKFELD